MRNVWLIPLFLIGSLHVSTASAQKLLPEIIKKGKQATALVVVASHEGFGTAFCVSSQGYFVTNQHVVEDHEDDIRLVLNPGQPDELVLHADVVRADKKVDLALLSIEEKAKLVPLTLGLEKGLFETAQVTALGYPFGTALAVSEQKYPNISVNTGRITSLRKSNGELQAIQLDAVINPGNSGGPVIDSNGHVIGVVRSGVGVLNAGVNLAIPVTRLRRFLDKPVLSFERPKIKYINRHDPTELTVLVTSLNDKLEEGHKVFLEWSSSENDRRRLDLNSKDGITYKATVIPVPKQAGTKQLRLTAEFPSGAIRCLINDVEIEADGRSIQLNEIKRIMRREGKFVIELHGDKQLLAERIDRFPGTARLGESSIEMDFLKASKITLSDLESDSGVIDYRLIVEDHGIEVAQLNGKIFLEKEADQILVKGEFQPLGGQSPWPSFLQPSDKAVYGTKGLHVTRDHFVRTKSGRFLPDDFTLEIEFTLESKDRKNFIGIIGIGEAISHQYGGPQNSVYMRIHPPGMGEGGVSIAKIHHGSGGIAMGKIRSKGTHLAKIQKKGNLVTFHIDVDGDGPSSDDLTRTIPDIKVHAPFLHEKNTHIFFGGGALFSKIRLNR